MEIRLITTQECSALADITVEAYQLVSAPAPIGDYEEELRAVESRRLSAEVYVAFDDGGVLMGGVTYVPGPESPMAEFTDHEAAGIRMLAVSPRFQGRGAGRALVQTCIDRALELHRERIILHSAPSMTRAQTMYVKLGFERAPDLDEWIHGDSEGPSDSLHLRAYVLYLDGALGETIPVAAASNPTRARFTGDSHSAPDPLASIRASDQRSHQI